MEANTLTLVNVWIPAAAALLGAVVGSGATLLVAWLTTKSEERKHYRELIVKAAVENFKESIIVAKTLNAPARIAPLDIYLIHMAKLTELFFDKKIRNEEIGAKLSELNRTVEIVREQITQQDRARGDLK